MIMAEMFVPGSTDETGFGVLPDREFMAAGRSLPNPLLLILVAFGLHTQPVRDEKSRVESDSELSDEVVISLGLLHRLHELTGPRAGNGAEVRKQLLAGHSNARVPVEDSGQI